MNDQIQKLEKEVAEIKKRNSKVEGDKGWETSFTRKLFISLITYFFAGIWLVMINDSSPWLKAFVPVVGYLLSTTTLPAVKRWWQSKYEDL